MLAGSFRLSSTDDPGSSGPYRTNPSGLTPQEREELPYKVEIWDEARVDVEQVLAVTASASIGYAAYFAATREFPHRFITLRHKNSVISRWNGSPN